MKAPHEVKGTGRFEARYVAFLETIPHLRPKLHRYCSRMTGSVLDGEDVVQEALFQGYRKLDTFDDTRPLGPWLFRIAHNACIDFLRRRAVRKQAEAEAAPSDAVPPVDPPGPALGRAVEHLVLTLPPKERACVLLKDVLDYSLEEIAELVGSTVGGVKAALSRGRSKLAAAPAQVRSRQEANAELQRLRRLYVERFNNADWDGLRELIAADAHLRVADRFDGAFSNSPYFGNYMKSQGQWRLTIGEVEGEAAIIVLGSEEGAWTPRSFVRLHIEDQHIVQITDYAHCPWVLRSATSTSFE